jgi:hypothetical protein
LRTLCKQHSFINRQYLPQTDAEIVIRVISDDVQTEANAV